MEQRAVVVAAAISAVGVVGLFYWLYSSNSTSSKSRPSRARRPAQRSAVRRKVAADSSGEQTGNTDAPKPIPDVQVASAEPPASEDEEPVSSRDTSGAGAAHVGNVPTIRDTGSSPSVHYAQEPTPAPTKTVASAAAADSTTDAMPELEDNCGSAVATAAMPTAESPSSSMTSPRTSTSGLTTSPLHTKYLPGVFRYERTTPLTEDSTVRTQLLVDAALLGRFIGRNGRNIKQLQQMGASVDMGRQGKHGQNDAQICTVSGRHAAVQEVMEQIGERFPSIAEIQITLRNDKEEYVRDRCPHPGYAQWPSTAERGLTDVAIVHLDSPSLFCVHLSKDGSIRRLNELSQFMTAFYNQAVRSRADYEDLTVGSYCAVPVKAEWARGVIVGEDEQQMWKVELVDFGAEILVSKAVVRPLRHEFCAVPFQAVKCQLAHVRPRFGDGNAWDKLPTQVFQLLTEGIMVKEIQCRQLTTSSSNGHLDSTNDTPICVEMYLKLDKQEEQVFVNRSLVERGCAKWVEAA